LGKNYTFELEKKIKIHLYRKLKSKCKTGKVKELSMSRSEGCMGHGESIWKSAKFIIAYPIKDATIIISIVLFTLEMKISNKKTQLYRKSR
jgi:hypothetical protein